MVSLQSMHQQQHFYNKYQLRSENMGIFFSSDVIIHVIKCQFTLQNIGNDFHDKIVVITYRMWKKYQYIIDLAI